MDLLLFGDVKFGKLLLLLLHLRFNIVLLMLMLLPRLLLRWIAVRRPYLLTMQLLMVLLLMVLKPRRRLVRPVVVIE